MRRLVLLAFAFAVAFAALGAREADAGRRFAGWLTGPEVLPERGAELEAWIFEENGKDLANAKTTFFTWAATVGVTDQLELSLPVEWRWARSDEKPANFTFTHYGIEARYRFVTQDPVDAPPLVPLVRVAIKRDVGRREAVVPELDAVVAYTAGRLQALVDLGVTGNLATDDSSFELRPGAAVSVQAVGDLRFGAEVYGEFDLDDSAASWAIVGPNLAWTHGRFWLSAAYGIGVYQIDNAPRFHWGLAF